MHYMIRILLFIAVLTVVFDSSFAVSDQYSNRLNSIVPQNARQNNNLGVYVESVTTGEPVFAFNHKKNFIPASNKKLVTSFAALHLLGKSFSYSTEFYSGGEIRNGVLYGGLYVKAGGDPSIDTKRLEHIVYELKNRGVAEIRGNIYLDDTYFDQQKYAEGWMDRWIGLHYCPPVGAFTLNYNTVDVKVTPTKVGNPPVVEVSPKAFRVQIINNAVTSNHSSALTARLDERNEYMTVGGRINARSGSQLFTISISSPTDYFGNVLTNLITEKGIRFEGEVKRREVPDWATLFHTMESPPLYEILSDFNKNSVNIIGESIVKTIGANFTQTPGTWDNGSRAITDFLQSMGMQDEIIIADGSGLSRNNSISPYMLVKILTAAYSEQSLSKEFIATLAVSGIDGTLKNRFNDSRLRGNIIAKTGYLHGVRALSGYIYTEKGEILAFSIISNGLGWETRAYQQDLLTLLLSCCN